DACALDISPAGDRHNHFLFRNKVFHRHIAVIAVQDVRAAVVTVLVHELSELSHNDSALFRRGGKDAFELGNLQFEFCREIKDLLTFKRRQATKLKTENRISLNLVDREQGHEPLAGGLS